MLPRGEPYRSESASASALTASPRLEVTRLLGRSAAPLSRLPTVAGSSSIHPVTPVVDRAVYTTEPTESTQPHLIRSTRHALKRPARAVGGRRVSAHRAAEAGGAFDVAMTSRVAKRARNMASWAPALPGLTYLRQSSITNKGLQSYMKLIAGFPTFWRSEVWPHRIGEPINLEMDAALERYMEEVFTRGKLNQCGSTLMAVIKFFLPKIGLTHRGPSHDKATLLRTLAEIKDRGRWGSDITVPGYKKEGRVAQQLQTLPPSTRVAAMAAPTQLAGNILAAIDSAFPSAYTRRPRQLRPQTLLILAGHPSGPAPHLPRFRKHAASGFRFIWQSHSDWNLAQPHVQKLIRGLLLQGTFKGFVMDLDWFTAHYDLQRSQIASSAFLYSLIETCRVMQLPWVAFGPTLSQEWPQFLRKQGGRSTVEKINFRGVSVQMQVCGFKVPLEDFEKNIQKWSRARLLTQSVFALEHAQSIHSLTRLWPIWANLPPTLR